MVRTKYYPDSALLNRLASVPPKSEVAIVVGCPLVAPTKPCAAGVPNVMGMIMFVRQEFIREPSLLKLFDEALKDVANPYQAAISFLQAYRGQEAVNQVIQKAVLSATNTKTRNTLPLNENRCKEMEEDLAAWKLSPGVEALGKIVSLQPSTFTTIITSNFDPLIEVSIQKAGGKCRKTILHDDGDIGQSVGGGCHVIHTHGYWYHFDTLHTVAQISRKRPKFEESLLSILKGKIVVVLAYGGWNDVFTRTLARLSGDATTFPQICWAFREKDPTISRKLKKILRPSVHRGRAIYYTGVDCHHFLPELAELLHNPSYPSLVA